MMAEPSAPKKQTVGTRRGNGAGYGGPAKGSGSSKPKEDFTVQTNAQGHNAHTTVEQGNLAAYWREQAIGLMQVLHGVANDPARGASQVKAIETFHNRVWGLPKATIIDDRPPQTRVVIELVGSPASGGKTIDHQPQGGMGLRNQIEFVGKR